MTSDPDSRVQRNRLSHVIAFDDVPFRREHRGDVGVVGAVFAGDSLHGVLTTTVKRDGVNSTTRLAAAIARSKFREHLQLVMLQGIAVAGFNVVDLAALSHAAELPVLVVARRAPDLERIREVLLTRVPGGRRKWRLIEAAGEMELIGGVYVQRAAISPADAARVIERFSTTGRIPEPLRVAHLIAGGIGLGESGGRV